MSTFPTASLLIAVLAGLGGPLIESADRIPADPQPSGRITISVRDSAYQVAAGSAVSGAAIVSNSVAWRTTVDPAQTQTYTVAGRVDDSAPASDLAVTACVHIRADAPAVSCASALSTAIATSTRNLAWIGAIIFGLFAALGALWLSKRVKPDLLTPENAHTLFGEDRGGPGGAPSA